MENLTKKEKRELAKRAKRQRKERKRLFLITKALIFVLLTVGIFGGGYLFFQKSAKELPGEKVADLGRNHVADGAKVKYNSNPPTSGPHYAEWTRAGIFSTPISDGHLVHSLEHGYVIISYNCTDGVGKQPSLIPLALAHEEKLLPVPNEDNDPDKEDEVLPGDIWESNECKNLVSRLSDIFKTKGERKLIIVPRPFLETRIALTAWGRIDKFNDFDSERIIAFIDAFRDKGPERTVE